MNRSEFVSGQMQGRVEVCNGNTYFTVCNDYWDALEATVVCHYLGYNTSSMFSDNDGSVQSKQFWCYNVQLMCP